MPDPTVLMVEDDPADLYLVFEKLRHREELNGEGRGRLKPRGPITSANQMDGTEAAWELHLRLMAYGVEDLPKRTPLDKQTQNLDSWVVAYAIRLRQAASRRANNFCTSIPEDKIDINGCAEIWTLRPVAWSGTSARSATGIWSATCYRRVSS